MMMMMMMMMMVVVVREGRKDSGGNDCGCGVRGGEVMASGCEYVCVCE